MAMLNSSAPMAELSKACSSEHCCHEPWVTLSEESIREAEEEAGEANTKFISFSYLKHNLASKLKVKEVESW